MADSSIEWTDATWNPVAGCTILSPGCTNCYAMRMAARLDAMGSKKYAKLTRRSGKRAVWTGRIYLDREVLAAPLGWSKSRMVFVNSMSDLFQDAVPANFIRDVWEVMKVTPRHTYQILTKRPERMAEIVRSLETLPNVWLGVSVESDAYYRRLDALRHVSSVIRFVSFEPLLSSVKHADLTDIDWAIVGGESGPRARPMEQLWVEEIRTACRKAGAAFFFKQWGGRNKKRAGRMFDKQTWDEFPTPRSSASVLQYS